MSSNKIIRRRSAQTLQGWQLGDLFAPVAPLPVPEAPPAAKKPAPKPEEQPENQPGLAAVIQIDKAKEDKGPQP